MSIYNEESEKKLWTYEDGKEDEADRPSMRLVAKLYEKLPEIMTCFASSNDFVYEDVEFIRGQGVAAVR